MTVVSPMTLRSPLLAQVIARADQAKGTAMIADSDAMPRMEPSPNNRIYPIPNGADPTVAAVKTSKAADPAIPCIMPTTKARMGRPRE